MAFIIRPTKHRLEAFSDGVFAIVVTMMLVDIHVPAGLAVRLPDISILTDFGILMLAYVVSYLVIMTLWISHHYLMLIISEVDRTLIWLNSLMLLLLSFIPMAARFIGDEFRSPHAAALYGAVLFGCTGAFGLIRLHASRVSHNADHRDIHLHVLRRIVITLVVYACAIPAAYFDIRLAWASFLITPVMFFVPVVRASRRSRLPATPDLQPE